MVISQTLGLVVQKEWPKKYLQQLQTKPTGAWSSPNSDRHQRLFIYLFIFLIKRVALTKWSKSSPCSNNYGHRMLGKIITQVYTSLTPFASIVVITCRKTLRSPNLYLFDPKVILCRPQLKASTIFINKQVFFFDKVGI